MSRIIDSVNLFGCSVGRTTQGEVKCDICGKIYNKGADTTEQYEDYDSVGVADFGDLQIVDCCWEKIENAVLDNMNNILIWYDAILEMREKTTKNKRTLLNKIVDKNKDK